MKQYFRNVYTCSKAYVTGLVEGVAITLKTHTPVFVIIAVAVGLPVILIASYTMMSKPDEPVEISTEE